MNFLSKKYFTVLTNKEGPWLKLTLDNPKKRNILNL